MYKDQKHFAFGHQLMLFYGRAGLSQAEFATLAGLSSITLHKWEAGESCPKAGNVKRVIEVLVSKGAFSKGEEQTEAMQLWELANQRGLKVPFDAAWFREVMQVQPVLATHAPSKGEPEDPIATPSIGTCLAPVPEEQLDSSPKKQASSYQYRETLTCCHTKVLISPLIHNMPFSPNIFFTGRESELLQLEHLFEHNKRIAITQPISISGLGGIGKTQLALEYAHRRYPHIYRSVLWVNAADKATLEASYLSLAHLLQLPEKSEREVDRIVQAVKIWLEERSHWLLILDNADDFELTCSYLPARPLGHILLTTRSQIVGSLAALIQVETMSPQEGLLFLLRRSGLLSPGAQLETVASDIVHEAEELVEMLAGHPLALDQAGAYIEETREPMSATSASLAEYRELYQQQSCNLLKSRGSLKGQHPESVALTFEISLQKASALHPGCADILSFCSLLHPDAIPEEMLCQQTALDLHLLSFNEAIIALRRYSLIKRDSKKKVLSIHRLVQAVRRDAMESQTLRQWMERVVRAVNAAFPEGDFEQWSRCEQFLPQVLACATWIERFTLSIAEAAHLFQKADHYLRERGQYADAEPLHQRALAIREQHLGAEHPDTASSLSNLALLYREQGKFEQAEPLYERALAIEDQHLGAEHPDTAMSLNNLALLYWQQGKYEQAEPLHQRALAIREQHLGAEHPDTASSLSNLALLYLQQGKYEQAEPLYERALAIKEQHLGAEHPDTASSLSNLALLYWQQGKYEQAEPLHQRALTIREQHLGAEHPDTAMSLNNLAILYQQQGKYEQAEPLYERALAIKEQHLGAEHPDTASSLHNLAFLYWRKGKYEQAEPLYERALAIQEQHLGACHPGTAHSLNNLAFLYYEQGKYSLAEPLYCRALAIREQHLGGEHPNTAESLHDLALLRLVQGKYEQAESLLARALTIREQYLGATHPDTTQSLHGLAQLYRKQGRYEQAEPLYQQALRVREQRLGASHPDTAESLYGLAQLCQCQGKYGQAEVLYQRALRIREQRLGPTHPETEDTRRAYATFLRLVEHGEEG